MPHIYGLDIKIYERRNVDNKKIPNRGIEPRACRRYIHWRMRATNVSHYTNSDLFMSKYHLLCHICPSEGRV
ncbi:hypothetical protein ACRALDRAFT_208982 [Sodiomyces alcalophilus JCM 7366]|uniref:uncharacterized protein n=1 Tax=Sodiomyces alcalophilus JCM 7366 TaxID=591952 RepID=UPI0039B3C533